MARQKAKKSKSREAKNSKKKRTVQPDDLLKFQLLGDPQISPDGEQILFSKKHVGEKNDYVTNLWMVSTDGGEPRQFTSGGKDGHGRWSPDGNTIAFISGREKPNPNIFTISAAGGEATPLTKFAEGSIGGFRWSPDGAMLSVTYRKAEPEWTEEAKEKRKETGGSTPARVIDEMFYRLDGDGYFNNQRFGLYIVDAKTGEHRHIFADKAGWFDFDWAPDSSQLVVSCNKSKEPMLTSWKDELFRIDVKTGKSKKIPNLPVGNKGAVRWSPNGKQIAYVGREGKEIWGIRNTKLFVCDAKTGSTRDLTGDQDYCLSSTTVSDTAEASFDANLIWSMDSKQILLNFGWHGETHIASVTVSGGKYEFLTKGRQSIAMGNRSDDGVIATVAATETELAEVSVGQFNSSGKLKLKQLTQFNKPFLDELNVVQPEEHWVTSSSGTKVQLWVIKPPGFKKEKKYPAVLEIHGGPHAQYGTSFFHEFQVLAAAGYVVVYSNPRGSKGYGEEHCIAIQGNWGQADWEDVQAVTAFMKKQPYIKQKKMGVMGGSYGGYMTNWAISHCDDFAGAITDRCVSNLVSMVGSSDLPLVPGEYWDGNSWDNTEKIWEQSPLKHFGNVKTPTLVIHSEGDLRCNVEQSEQVFAALKLRGVPTRFVRYPFSTSHGMSRMGPPDLRMHRLGQILDWWKKYLA